MNRNKSFSRKARKTAGRKRHSARSGKRGHGVDVYNRPINLFIRRCFIILSDSGRARSSEPGDSVFMDEDRQFLRENNNGAGEIGSAKTIPSRYASQSFSLVGRN